MQPYYSSIPALNYVGAELQDPLAQLLGISDFGSVSGFLFLQFLLIAIGFVWMLRQSGAALKESWVTALVFLFASIFVLGLSPIEYRWYWFPVVAGAYLGAGSGSLLSLGVLALSLLALLVTAGTLAPFACLLLVTLPIFSGAIEEGKQAQLPSRAVLALVACVIAVLLVPVYPMPEYPGEARLVPISPLLLDPIPLIGPYLHPNPIYYTAYIESLSVYTLRFVFVAVALLIAAIVRSKQNPENTLLRVSFAICLLVSVLLVGGEWLLGPDYSSGAPFPVISRIVPGLRLSALPWTILPLLLVPLMALWVRVCSLIDGLVMLALIGSAIFIVQTSKELAPYVHFEYAFPTASDDSRRWEALAFMRLNKGDWIKTPRRFENLERLKNGVDFVPLVTASPLAEEANLAIDGVAETRWRTGRPQQAGDYFTVTFNEPLSLVRAVLSVKGVPTDFPRAIAVDVVLADGAKKRVFSEPDWLGPVKWTEQGMPYLGPQSEVILDFPEQYTVTAVTFVQLVDEKFFDWSISEIKFYREANGEASRG